MLQGTWLLKETSSGTFDSLTCQVAFVFHQLCPGPLPVPLAPAPILAAGSCAGTCGGMRLADGHVLLTAQHTAVDLADSCLLVWGGPWLLDACSIRSRGGTGIRRLVP